MDVIIYMEDNYYWFVINDAGTGGQLTSSRFSSIRDLRRCFNNIHHYIVADAFRVTNMTGEEWPNDKD